MDRVPDFESVGCAFESRRGRLYVGVLGLANAYMVVFAVRQTLL